MKARRIARGLSLLGLGAVVGSAAAAGVNNRRWARTPDRTGGSPLSLPIGSERTVVSGDGAELWVTEMGATDPGAPLVVFSHCWTGDHRVWAPVARRLLDDHRVVLYDQRGHGRSTVGSTGLTQRALADDLAAVLEAVDARHAVVAGHSMGGMSAQLLAVHHPDLAAERVDHLVLVATACDNLSYGPAHENLLAAMVERPLPGWVVASPLLGPSSIRGVFGRRPNLDALRATALTFVNTPPEVRAGMIRTLTKLDLSAVLPSVAIPASIIVGSLDTLTPVARARRIHELLPDSTLEVLPGRGHMLPFEAPDEVAALIRDAASYVTALAEVAESGEATTSAVAAAAT